MKEYNAEDHLIEKAVISLIRDYNQIICIYHPQCREETLRWFLAKRITFPSNSVNDYNIYGIDLTELLQTNKNMFLLGDNSILKQAEERESLSYRFSKDYAFEWISKT
jgi:hypothetical protein